MLNRGKTGPSEVVRGFEGRSGALTHCRKDVCGYMYASGRAGPGDFLYLGEFFG